MTLNWICNLAFVFFLLSDPFQPLLKSSTPLYHPLVFLTPLPLIKTPCFLCPPLGRTGVRELSGGHLLSQHTHGYAYTWNMPVCVKCVCVGVSPCVCPYPGGRKAGMLTLSSAWRGGGRWRFGELATPVFPSRLGSTWKAGFVAMRPAGVNKDVMK